MRNDQQVYWTAFYTKPRSEKKTSERLESQGYDIYCPTKTVVKQWSDRKKKVKEPVFTSYIFARVDETSRACILMDPGVVANVFWLGKPVVIRGDEIEAIKSFLHEYPDAEVSQLDFRTGDEIQVKSGPLSGQNGLITRINGNKASLCLSSLGVELRAEVALVHLERVG